MKILFIGDIVGKMGRQAVNQYLPSLKKQHQIDFVIANAENSAHGKGITAKIYHQLLSYGIDFMTLGNHAFSKADVEKIIEEPKIIRPLNLDNATGGRGYRVVDFLGISILIANICGTVFMDQVTISPFEAIEPVLKEKADIKILDFHGEATSEKIAFAFHYGKYFNAILGTHTHVQTADERIINGCAFISDVGMTGPYQSVLGRDTTEVLKQLVAKEKTHYTISENPAVFSAVIIEIDDNYQTKNISRIQIRPE